MRIKQLSMFLFSSLEALLRLRQILSNMNVRGQMPKGGGEKRHKHKTVNVLLMARDSFFETVMENEE